MNNTYDWVLYPNEESAVLKIKEALHRHPELSFEEHRTSELIRSVLGRMDGVKILDLPIDTGVVAVIRGGASGKLVGLRADIDALPIREVPTGPAVSQNDGVMHACGHDFHTAALLGAAQVLSRNRAELRGNVMLIFQPAEEITAGARYLLEAGMYNDYRPDCVFGMHNRPDIQAGKVVAEAGYRMAGKYNYNIRIHGKSSHSGSPQDSHDPIVCACALVTALQSIISRNISPLDSATVGIESIQSNNEMKHQMVDDVWLEGSVRAHDDKVRDLAFGRVCEMTEQIAAAYGCEAELTVEDTVPATYNTQEMADIAKRAAIATVGEQDIISVPGGLGCEDFGWLLKETPGYYYWLGSGRVDDTDETEYPGWHDPAFHTNDAALPIAANLLIQSVLEAQK